MIFFIYFAAHVELHTVKWPLCAPCRQSANLWKPLGEKELSNKVYSCSLLIVLKINKIWLQNLVVLGNLSKQSCESETALFRAVTGSDKRALNIGGNDSSWRWEAKETLVPGFTYFIQERRNKKHESPLCNCWVYIRTFLAFPWGFKCLCQVWDVKLEMNLKVNHLLHRF